MFALRKAQVVRIKSKMTDRFTVCQDTQHPERIRDFHNRRVNCHRLQCNVSGITAYCSSRSNGTISSVSSCVASRTTGHAAPARCTWSHLAAQTHQRSPGFRPGNPNCGIGVERSFPNCADTFRNSSVTTQQTVCFPGSWGPVLQQPSRKKPVIGSSPQLSSGWPSTFF